ncbi:bifunctional dihydroflavonol 4-reductase/flavanone 4-reductase-like [Argentina anserina]|uniref:bifunctional dihydroflavonol 4-reductase/flavanone 4-reductase-like n=1 Tax=Argentina anserina TaxID=57926 RepID=UPI0021766BBF|nr:bifunctional dihydroflavonol 4-reductase/flavanone 4-reductase-like [Potentilla anserina]
MGLQAESGTVCVTGASGFVGSWLVMRLLERGYTVRATVRDPDNMKKVGHLLELPMAATRLTLWKADLDVEGSFDEAINGCSGVFHVATPMDFESEDPENEVIKPTVNGMLDIMKACLKAKTVRKVVFTSSAGTVTIEEHRKAFYNENNWTDVEFCRKVKMTGWMYFVSKTLAEQEAWKFAKENNIDFISIIPTLVIGPFLAPSMPPSLITGLAPLTGNEAHYGIIKQCQYVHLDDLCLSHIFLYEHPTAEGRYICSSHDATIHEIAKLLSEKYPEYNVPTKFEGIQEKLTNIHFSSKKLKETGFEFKYSLEDMFTGAVDTCKAKGLLPIPSEEEEAEERGAG